MGAEKTVHDLLAGIGITVGGPEPFDIQVHDRRFYRKVLAEASLGLGESYMAGWWDAEDLLAVLSRLAASDLEDRVKGSWKILYQALKAKVLNLQSRRRSPIVALEHYDPTAEHYRAMFQGDPWLAVSCGYWRNASNLGEAQEAKLELICRKIGLSAEDRVLDIGCGFGSFTRYAATHYGCRVVGINVAPGQLAVARELSSSLPIEYHRCDYRQPEVYAADGRFDKIVSVGMFEHVGYKNHRTYMTVVRDVLKDGGIFLLHTMGTSPSRTHNDPWLEKYIFPNGLLPSMQQISRAAEEVLVMEDWHNFGPDYATTCRAWWRNFDRAWEGSRDEEFYRMWKFYMMFAAAGFGVRQCQLWQIVFSAGGLPETYHRPQ